MRRDEILRVEFTLVLVHPHIQNRIPQPVSASQLQTLGLCNLVDLQ